MTTATNLKGLSR